MSESDSSWIECIAPARRVSLSEDPVLIGRDPVACQIVLEEDTLLSRRHFALVPQGRGAVLIDLRSSNGTFVDGSRVHTAILRGGESIRAGSSQFRFQASAESQAVDLLRPARTSLLSGGKDDPALEVLRRIQAPDFRALDVFAQAQEILPTLAATLPLQESLLLALFQEQDLIFCQSVGPDALGLETVLGLCRQKVETYPRTIRIDFHHQDLGYLPPGYPRPEPQLTHVEVAPFPVLDFEALLLTCGGESRPEVRLTQTECLAHLLHLVFQQGWIQKAADEDE